MERDGDGQTRNFERKLGGVGSRLGKGFSDQGSEAINDAKMLWEVQNVKFSETRSYAALRAANVDGSSG